MEASAEGVPVAAATGCDGLRAACNTTSRPSPKMTAMAATTVTAVEQSPHEIQAFMIPPCLDGLRSGLNPLNS
jgi:hypothetical protein